MPAATMPAAPPNAGNPTVPRGRVSDGRRRWRKAKSGFAAALSCISALIVIAPLGLVFGYLLVKGAGSLNWDFFTKLPAQPTTDYSAMFDEPAADTPAPAPGSTDANPTADTPAPVAVPAATPPAAVVHSGVANSIVGTFVLIAIAAVFGVPVGVLGALYLSEYATVRVASSVRFGADVLNGVPSIVWGIVAYALFIPPGKAVIHLGYSALAAGITLGFIMIPLVLRTTEEVLRLVPNGYREAALALGISEWRISLLIVAKTASKGIVTGVLLAVARIAGETAPLLFTALGNEGWSKGLLQPIDSLPWRIFKFGSQSSDPDQNRQAWAAALVLIVLVLGLNLALRFLTRERIVKRAVAAQVKATLATAAPPTAAA